MKNGKLRKKNEGRMEMVRVTPSRLFPVSAFIFIIFIGQKILKKKKKIIYTYEMNTAIIYDRSQRVQPASTTSEYNQRVQPASTPIETSDATRELVK